MLLPTKERLKCPKCGSVNITPWTNMFGTFNKCNMCSYPWLRDEVDNDTKHEKV